MEVLVRGYLRSVWVEFNGDEGANEHLDKVHEDLKKKQKELAESEKEFAEKKQTEGLLKKINRLYKEIDELKDDRKNNTLVVSLIQPGTNGNLEVVKKVVIGNSEERGTTINDDDFFVNGLFKQKAMGEFGLRVSVTDTDEANPIVSFLRGVFATAFASFKKTRIDGLANVITASTATQLSGGIKEKVKGNSDDKVHIVGKTPTAYFEVDGGDITLRGNAEEGIEFVDNVLTLPLKTPELLRLGTNSEGKVRYLPRGASNGEIKLRLTTD